MFKCGPHRNHIKLGREFCVQEVTRLNLKAPLLPDGHRRQRDVYPLRCIPALARHFHKATHRATNIKQRTWFCHSQKKGDLSMAVPWGQKEIFETVDRIVLSPIFVVMVLEGSVIRPRKDKRKST